MKFCTILPNDPLLGKQTDGIAGRIIDLLAVFALLAGTATTFSVATPLMAGIIGPQTKKEYLGFSSCLPKTIFPYFDTDRKIESKNIPNPIIK